MKDFRLRNDTELVFANRPAETLERIMKGKRTLFVFGGGSVNRNGCYDDVHAAAEASGATLFDLPGSSRERAAVEKGIRIARENGIELVVGAGGASVMDCAKLIAFGSKHDDWWDFVKGKNDPYGCDRLGLALMPTYPSSGSEYGLGAVCVDKQTGDFGTAYGIPADTAILAPKYSASLDRTMTAYAGLVTVVQLSASTIGDANPISYGEGVSTIRAVVDAVRRLAEDPADEDARGVVLYGAAIATSGRLGLGKTENYAYEIYELEFIPEMLFDAPYRKSLTTLFPPFLRVMGARHETDAKAFLRDAFGFEGTIAESADKLSALFADLGLEMGFEGVVDAERIKQAPVGTTLSHEEVLDIVSSVTTSDRRR